MKDRVFKADFLNGSYPIKKDKSDDILKVKLVYESEIVDGVYKNNGINIVQVIEFNGLQISKIAEYDPKLFIDTSLNLKDQPDLFE